MIDMMQLWKRIEDRLSRYPLDELLAASSALRTRYREGRWKLSLLQKWCYTAFRMPATYAVIQHVSHQVSGQSILDLGAGPGTGSFVFPQATVTSVERDEEFIMIGRELEAPTEWVHSDLLDWIPQQEYDLTLLSYSYGESPQLNLISFWRHTRMAMLLIEPGTPTGWQHLLQARDQLLREGAHIWAPCAHSRACPLKSPDWCHFGIRFQRPPLHRTLKEAVLNYEEEKFFYILMGKEPRALDSRVLRPPQKRSGHVMVKLCTPEGVVSPTIGKSHSFYKTIRNADWGDSLAYTNLN